MLYIFFPFKVENFNKNKVSYVKIQNKIYIHIQRTKYKLQISQSSRIRNTIRLLPTSLKLSTITNLLSFQLFKHLQNSLLHSLLKTSIYLLFISSKFSRSLKLAIPNLTFNCPAIPVNSTLKQLSLYITFCDGTIFENQLSFSLSLIILPLSLVNISAIESVFSISLLLIKYKLTLVYVSRSILNTAFSFNDSFLDLAHKRIFFCEYLALPIQNAISKSPTINIPISKHQLALSLKLIFTKITFKRLFLTTCAKSQDAFTLSVSSFHLPFIYTPVAIRYLSSSLSFSIYEIAYYVQLRKGIEQFPSTIKLAIAKLALIVRAIFKFVDAFAIRLVMFKFSLVEVTVYKYDLTFWHQKYNNHHYNFLLLRLLYSANL